MKKEKKLNQFKKILWVEDDYYHLKGLFKKVEKKGFSVIPARSYIEAKTLLKNESEFCMIVLDLIIPYSESTLVDPDLKNIETNDDATKNGVLLFDFIIGELKLDIPILILTMAQTPNIINNLISRRKFVKKIEKSGTLPIDVKRQVMEMIKLKNIKN